MITAISKHDLRVARRAAWLAWVSYRENAKYLPPVARVVENRNARAVVIEQEDCIEISMAGSDDYKDWLGNIMRWKVERGGIGKVYDGVADYYGLIRDRLRDVISDHQKPVRLAGHSLGGAAIEMFAARRVLKGKPVASLDTFGAPMVGDEEFCAASRKIPSARNWWVPGDVVPYQPAFAGILSFGFRRARAPHVVKGGKITRTVPMWRPPVAEWMRGRLMHSMEKSYLVELDALARRAA